MIYHKVGQSYCSFEDEGKDLSDLAETVKLAVKALKPHVAEFDSIAVTGVSGLLVGPSVACFLKKPVVVIRKEDDDSHNRRVPVVNADNMGERVLFLDDFVAGGSTFGRVSQHVLDVSNGRSKVVARFLYRDLEYVIEDYSTYTGEATIDGAKIPF